MLSDNMEDYTELGVKCPLDELVIEMTDRHKVPIKDYKLVVSEETRREFCKSCGDWSCWSYKKLFGSE